MVSSLSILLMVVTLFLSVIVPVVLLIILLRGRKGFFSAWLAGALGFFIPQLLIRIPILQFIGTTTWYAELAKNHFVLLALLLAVTAGLFETAGRFLVFRVGLKKRLSYMTGLSAGLGHGAVESIVLIGLTYVNNLVISLAINAGSLESLVPDAELAGQVTSALTETSPDLFLAAGVERIFTMAFHAALSVLLCYLMIKGRSAIGFLAVMALHAAIDFAAVMLPSFGLTVWPIEGGLAVVAVASILLIIRIRPRFKDHLNIPPDPGEEAVEQGY